MSTDTGALTRVGMDRSSAIGAAGTAGLLALSVLAATAALWKVLIIS